MDDYLCIAKLQGCALFFEYRFLAESRSDFVRACERVKWTCIMGTVHACIIAEVHACLSVTLHACSMGIVYAYTIALSNA